MWLESHVRLPQYSTAFRDNNIDGRFMPRYCNNQTLQAIQSQFVDSQTIFLENQCTIEAFLLHFYCLKTSDDGTVNIVHRQKYDLRDEINKIFFYKIGFQPPLPLNTIPLSGL